MCNRIMAAPSSSCASQRRPTVRAQAPAAAPAELTALDYFQIQQLVARYASRDRHVLEQRLRLRGSVHGRRRFRSVVRRQAGDSPIQGRERLAAVSGGGSNGCKNVPWIAQGVRHIYTNHIITPTADGASGTVDMLMIGLGGDPNKIEYDGHYEDTYVRTPQGWRFKQRVHHALLREGQRVTPPAASR